MFEEMNAIIEHAAARMTSRSNAYIRKVLAETARRKEKGLPLTDPQKRLVEFISRRKGRLTFKEACEIEWRSLGGLFVRGKLVWDKKHNLRLQK